MEEWVVAVSEVKRRWYGQRWKRVKMAVLGFPPSQNEKNKPFWLVRSQL